MTTKLRVARLLRLSLLALAFYGAALQAAPLEAADGYYSGLKLPYASGAARVVVRVTEHGPGRHAVDFGLSYEDVLAMYPGQVAWTGAGQALYGNYVVVDHLDNYCSIYAHFDRLYVRGGQAVQQGERLGRSGNSGNSTGPHLHAAVFRKINGICGPANAWTEVSMLFDESPSRELRAGDWIVSRNVRQAPAAAPIVDSLTAHSIAMRWSAYPGDARALQVERREGTGPWLLAVSLAATASRYMDDGLSPGASYCYRSRWVNERGDASYSGSVCALTLSAGGIALSQTGAALPAGSPGSPTYLAAAMTSNPWPASLESPALDAVHAVQNYDANPNVDQRTIENERDPSSDAPTPWAALAAVIFDWLSQQEPTEP